MRKNRRIEIQEGNECLKYSNSIVKRQSLNRSNEDDNLIDDKRFFIKEFFFLLKILYFFRFLFDFYFN